MCRLRSAEARQTATERELALEQIVLHATCALEFTQRGEVLDGQALLGEAPCEKSTSSAPIAIHEGANGHETQPEARARLDQSGCGGIFVEHPIKITQAPLEFFTHPIARRTSVRPPPTISGCNNPRPNRGDTFQTPDSTIEKPQVVYPCVFALSMIEMSHELHSLETRLL